jgi:peptidoglycan/xylan/chitin deacetylase (PgdA/CDA1 family)
VELTAQIGGRFGRRVARAAGFVRRRRRRGREAHGLVLMYHRVADQPVDPWELCVRPEHFESQVRALRQHMDIVPLDRLRQELRRGRRSRPVVAITFDDGYVDNLTVAKPVLQRHEAPATVFLATGHVGQRRAFWWDRLAKLLLNGAPLPARLELTAGSDRFLVADPTLKEPDSRGQQARRQLHDRLWDWCCSRAPEDREYALTGIERWSGVKLTPDPADWPMSAEQVRELVDGGLVEIGAHTVTHRMLSRLASADKASEIRQARADCRELTGRDPTCFAYPHGDLDAESAALVRQAGFETACTSEPDLVWATDDPFATPRLFVPNESGQALLRRLRWYWLA